MATLRPFRALRPKIADAARIAAVPYDVVNVDEARALAAGNPLSFLHVSRAEIDLPPGADPYSNAVYQRAAENFAALKRSSLVVEDAPSLYPLVQNGIFSGLPEEHSAIEPLLFCSFGLPAFGPRPY